MSFSREIDLTCSFDDNFEAILKIFESFKRLCKEQGEDGSAAILNVKYHDGEVTCFSESERKFRDDAYGRKIHLKYFSCRLHGKQLKFEGRNLKKLNITCDSRERLSRAVEYMQKQVIDGLPTSTDVNNITIINSTITNSNIGSGKMSTTTSEKNPSRWCKIWDNVLVKLIYGLLAVCGSWLLTKVISMFS